MLLSELSAEDLATAAQFQADLGAKLAALGAAAPGILDFKNTSEATVRPIMEKVDDSEMVPTLWGVITKNELTEKTSKLDQMFDLMAELIPGFEYT